MDNYLWERGLCLRHTARESAYAPKAHTASCRPRCSQSVAYVDGFHNFITDTTTRAPTVHNISDRGERSVNQGLNAISLH